MTRPTHRGRTRAASAAVASLLGASLVGFAAAPAHASGMTSAYKMSLFAGRMPGGVGLPPTDAKLAPASIAADGNGNVFFIDTNAERVEKLAPNGTLSVVAGAGIPWQNDAQNTMTPQPGPATDSAINPVAIAVDNAGDVFISDNLGYVEKVTPDGTLSIIAGRGNLPGWAAPTAGPALASTISPAGIAVDSAGTLYVGDNHGYIVRITSAGALTYFAGNGNSYVGGTMTKPTPGPALSSTASGEGLTVDPAGNLYSVGGGWAERITPDGTLSIIAGPVYNAGVPFPMPATSYPIRASSIAVDGSGDVFLNDGLRVFKVTPDGTMNIYAGYDGLTASQQSFPPKPGPATDSPMSANALATDPSGNLYIADAGVRSPYGTYVPPSGYIEKVASDGTTWGATLSVLAGDSRTVPAAGPAATAGSITASSVATDTAGNVYTATSGRIARITPAGDLSFVAGNGSSGAPVPGPATSSPLGVSSLAVDASGDVYGADVSGYVVKIDPSGTLSIVAGHGVRGEGSSGQAANADITPQSIAVDTAGNLYIASGQVLKVAPDGTMSVIYADTTINSTYINRRASSVAVSPVGTVYFGEGNGVDRINPDGSTTIVAGNSYGSEAPQPGPATGTTVYPTGLTFDAGGTLYIAGGGYVTSVTAAGVLSVIAGGGDTLTSSTGWATQVSMTPNDVALDSHGTVYVSTNDGEIAALTPAPTTAPSTPTNISARAGATSANVQFAPSLDMGGTPVTSYTASDGAGHSCSPTLTTTNPAKNTYLHGYLSCWITGLAPGTPVSFTVTATNAAGTSAASTPSSTVIPYTVPGQPDNVAGTPDPAGSAVQLSWTAPTSDGWSPITGYVVTGHDLTPNVTWTAPVCTTAQTSTATSCTAGGLVPGHAYEFTVAARNWAGTGAASAASQPITPASPPPPPPSAPNPPYWVVAVAHDSGNAQVGWTIPYAGGSPITSYTITTVSASDGHLPAPTTVTASSLPGGGANSNVSTYAWISGLTNGVTYTFQVVATNAVGDSTPSAVTNPITPGPITTTVTGVPLVGATLTAATTQAASVTTVYHWLRNGVQVANGSTYLIVPADAGTTLTLEADSSAPGSAGTTSTNTFDVVAADHIAVPMTSLIVNANSLRTVTMPLAGRATYALIPNSSTPRGVSLASTGALTVNVASNTATPFVRTFQYRTYAGGSAYTATVRLTVNPGAIAFHTGHILPSAHRGAPYATTIQTVRGWGTNDRFARVAGSLPQGLTLAHTSGGQYCRIVGRATRSGTYRFELKASDARGRSTLSWFTIVVR